LQPPATAVSVKDPQLSRDDDRFVHTISGYEKTHATKIDLALRKAGMGMKYAQFRIISSFYYMHVGSWPLGLHRFRIILRFSDM
jgi:hypothetical protein